MIRIFIVCHFGLMYDVLYKYSTRTRTHTLRHAHKTQTFYAYSCFLVALFPHMPPPVYRCAWMNETRKKIEKEGNAFKDSDIFLAHFYFYSFSFAFVFVLRVFLIFVFLHILFFFSAPFGKSQKKRRKKLGRFHCINERKYAHLDEKYLNDSGFLPPLPLPLPMRNEALQMNYHHFYVTQYIYVCICMNWRSKYFF